MSPPLVDFSATFAPRTSAEFSPHHRPDTPQLTLHDYHKIQQSPLLSASPEYDDRRVRRKPSLANLAGAPPWTSSETSPHLAFSFAPAPLLSSLPLPSTTAQSPPATSSPSLSSTVTTLQSTPTHTPIFRADSHFEQRRDHQRIELTEPIRTKRKFDRVKPAKRLRPRTASSAASGSSSTGRAEIAENDGQLWEVYAAVFEPSTNYQGFEDELVDLNRHSHGQRWLQPAPLFTELTESRTENIRSVRFKEADLESHENENVNAPEVVTSREERDTTATSSYSLSRFQFPVPPGHNNWGGTSGYISEPNTPKSPTTLRYHGASFDVVNPHASLLLEGLKFETPAEIDGLLDDYFDSRPTSSDMAPKELNGEASQESLRSGSDSSRHARVLYDDPDDARRHILGRPEDFLSPPSKAIINDSPQSRRIDTVQPTTLQAPQLPAQQLERKPSTNPFRNLQLSRMLGFVTANETGDPNDVTKIDEGSNPADTVSSLVTPGPRGLGSKEDDLKHCSKFSDPFDLSISESGSHANLMSIGQILKSEYNAGNKSPILQQGADKVDSSTTEEGAVPHATYVDEESDPTVKEIIGSYDYTRVATSPEKADSTADSPPVEYGRGTLGVGPIKQPMPLSHLSVLGRPNVAQTEPVRQTHKQGTNQPKSSIIGQEWPLATTKSPQTPAAGTFKVYSGCSELPTSSQTYGDTNQLLQITPQQVTYPPYPGPSGGIVNPFVSNRSRYISPASGNSGRSAGTVIVYDRNRDSNVPNDFRFFDSDEEGEDDKPPQRNSGVYVYNDVFDDVNLDEDEADDAWETEATRSSAALPRRMYGRQSEDSYADTSAYGTENRLSIGPEILSQMPSMPGNTGSGHNKLPRGISFPPPPSTAEGDDDYLRDYRKAFSLLSNHTDKHQLGSKQGSLPNLDKEQRRLDLAELERIRRNNPLAVRAASEALAQRALQIQADAIPSKKLKRRSRLRRVRSFKPDYNPETVFKKANDLRSDSNQSMRSDLRVLLDSPQMFQMDKVDSSLEWSESVGEFVSIRSHAGSPVRNSPTPKEWSPFHNNPTQQALRLPSPALASFSEPGRNAVELGRSSERAMGKRPRRAAIDGQHGLHELALLRPQRDSAKTGRGLTDKQLARAEPGWSCDPSKSRKSPLTRVTQAASQPDVENQEQSPTLHAGRNMADQAALDPEMREKAKQISRKYAKWCYLCPVTSLLFGSGLFDWRMRQLTGGRVNQMEHEDKKSARITAFPLSAFVWAIVGIVIAILVIMPRDKPEDSTPFASGM